MKNKQIVFLVSGNGGTLEFLFEAIKILNLPLEINKVIADRQCGAYNIAKKNNIPALIIDYSKEYNKALISELKNTQADLIITNIHKLLDVDVLNTHLHKFINLHYSLLPAYSGQFVKNIVEKARQQNVLFLGATCHKVDESCDAGEILCQACFAVDWKYPIDDIFDKLYRTSCLAFLNAIIIRFNLSLHCKQETTGDMINPAAQFDTTIFNETFFEKIKKKVLNNS